jgi:hypothetical protein
MTHLDADPTPQPEPTEVDWEVADDLVADGWPEEDAIRFATGRRS